MTNLFPNAELAVSNLSGNVNDLRDEDFATGYETADDDLDTDLRVGMDDPGADLSGTQTVRFGVRKSSDAGNDPDVTFYLYENGAQVAQLGAVETITADTGEEYTRTFEDVDITNSNDVEFRIEGQRSGGKPAARRTVEPRYITWEAVLDVFVDVTTLEPTALGTDTATLNGQLDWQDSTVDVWFEWGEVGTGFPNSTTAQTFTDTGSHAFDETLINLSEDTEYEYRAHGDRDNGADTSQGDVVTFWTEPESPASPTNLTGEFV